jgi:hypothetical protein
MPARSTCIPSTTEWAAGVRSAGFAGRYRTRFRMLHVTPEHVFQNLLFGLRPPHVDGLNISNVCQPHMNPAKFPINPRHPPRSQLFHALLCYGPEDLLRLHDLQIVDTLHLAQCASSCSSHADCIYTLTVQTTHGMRVGPHSGHHSRAYCRFNNIVFEIIPTPSGDCHLRRRKRRSEPWDMAAPPVMPEGTSIRASRLS